MIRWQFVRCAHSRGAFYDANIPCELWPAHHLEICDEICEILWFCYARKDSLTPGNKSFRCNACKGQGPPVTLSRYGFVWLFLLRHIEWVAEGGGVQSYLRSVTLFMCSLQHWLFQSHMHRTAYTMLSNRIYCTMCIVEYTVILPKQNQLTYTHMRRRINATWPSARDFWAHIRDSLTHIHASHANRRNSGIAGKIDIMYTA